LQVGADLSVQSLKVFVRNLAVHVTPVHRVAGDVIFNDEAVSGGTPSVLTGSDDEGPIVREMPFVAVKGLFE
jgi:hypothetical protein